MNPILFAASLTGIASLAVAILFSFRIERGSMTTCSSTLVVTLPVFATVINFATGGGLPNWRHIAAWVLVATAVWLVSSGKPVPAC